MPIVEPSGQAVLLEVRPTATAAGTVDQRTPRSRRPRRQVHPLIADERPVAVAGAEGTLDPELTTWFAEFLAKAALESAQLELANRVPAGPPMNGAMPLE